MLRDYRLDTVEGRVAALEKTVPLVAQIKDHALRPAYARRLAGMIGNTDEAEVSERVRQLTGEASGPGPSRRSRVPKRSLDDVAAAVEREAVKSALQVPEIAGPAFDAIPAEAYTHPEYAAVAAAVGAAGGAAAAGVTGATWLEKVAAHCDDEAVRRQLTGLAVEPLHPATTQSEAAYVNAVLARLQEMTLVRRIAELKGRLQRMNPVEAPDYMKHFEKLVALEQEARSLRERGMGGLTA
jgi:DNA primase